MQVELLIRKIVLAVSVMFIAGAFVFLNASDQMRGEKYMTVKQSIDRLKDYAKQQGKDPEVVCQGASDEEIETLKTSFEVGPPESFIDVFKYCSKDDPKYADVRENCSIIFGTSSCQHSISLMKQINKDMSEIDDSFKDQIIFYDWDATYYAVLNMRQDDKSYGKVLCVHLESGIFDVWADSYEEWLELMVNEVVRSGDVDSKFIEKVLKKAGLNIIH